MVRYKTITAESYVLYDCPCTIYLFIYVQCMHIIYCMKTMIENYWETMSKTNENSVRLLDAKNGEYKYI